MRFLIAGGCFCYLLTLYSITSSEINWTVVVSLQFFFFFFFGWGGGGIRHDSWYQWGFFFFFFIYFKYCSTKTVTAFILDTIIILHKPNWLTGFLSVWYESRGSLWIKSKLAFYLCDMKVEAINELKVNLTGFVLHVKIKASWQN